MYENVPLADYCSNCEEVDATPQAARGGLAGFKNERDTLAWSWGTVGSSGVVSDGPTGGTYSVPLSASGGGGGKVDVQDINIVNSAHPSSSGGLFPSSTGETYPAPISASGGVILMAPTAAIDVGAASLSLPPDIRDGPLQNRLLLSSASRM